MYSHCNAGHDISHTTHYVTRNSTSVSDTNLLAIETENLSKRFGHFVAVNSVTFNVRRGTIFGFLGPNGAGKTTTMRMLLGLLTPSGGKARILGACTGAFKMR